MRVAVQYGTIPNQGHTAVSYGAYIHDGAHQPVVGARVTLSSAAGTFTCTTQADGGCGVASTVPVKKRKVSFTFSVTAVSLAGATYDAGANHDVTGDSDGTTLTLRIR